MKKAANTLLLLRMHAQGGLCKCCPRLTNVICWFEGHIGTGSPSHWDCMPRTTIGAQIYLSYEPSYNRTVSPFGYHPTRARSQCFLLLSVTVRTLYAQTLQGNDVTDAYHGMSTSVGLPELLVALLLYIRQRFCILSLHECLFISRKLVQ